MKSTVFLTVLSPARGCSGRFSYLRFGKIERLILIAGGIGITPILSCLRYMAATNFDKPVTLIWFVGTSDYYGLC